MKFAQHLEAMDEIEVVLKKFGDEQSTLLDRFERISFEVQLSQAMLRRSLSEPTVVGPQGPVVTTARATVAQVRRRRDGSAFRKVLKKLLKPILCRKRGGTGGRREREVPDPKHPCSWKAFSRSLRV
jgi:hypothetical protein